MDSII